MYLVLILNPVINTVENNYIKTLCVLSHVWLFATPWTVPYEAIGKT